MVAELAVQGLAASTRRCYVQAFKGFHAFLVARKSAAIESAFGVRLASSEGLGAMVDLLPLDGQHVHHGAL